MHDKAIEVAAVELMLAATVKIERDTFISELSSDELRMLTRAAIIAYLRNVEVTQEMHLAAMNRKSDTLYKGIFEAMCAAKADELENGL